MKTLLFSILLIGVAYADTTVSLPDDAKIYVPYKEPTELGITFKDSLCYTPSQWANVTAEEIASEKQKRVTNFVNAVKNPPIPVEPTKEQLEEQKAQLQEQINSIQTQINAKGGK